MQSDLKKYMLTIYAKKSLLGKNKSKILFAVTNHIVRILLKKNIRNKSGCVILEEKKDKSEK